MKILDRYVLRLFLYNYAISFIVLIGLYIVLDMVMKFDELVDFRGDAQMSTFELISHITSFYFYQTFLIFVHLSGVIPVVAASFTLLRLSRFNELSAVLAAGTPLWRVVTPIIIAGLILQGLLMIDQELIIPNIINKVNKKIDAADSGGGNTFPIQAMQDDKRGLVFAGKFYPTGAKPAMMLEVDVIENDENLQPMSHLTADRADWVQSQGYWRLTNGQRVTGLRPDQKRSDPVRVNTYKSNITPEEIALYHSGEFVNMLSRERINQLIEKKQVYGALDLLRVKHFRISQLFINFLMLLLAIPFVTARDPSRLRTSLLWCLVLVGLCMASYFVAYLIAGRPPEGAEWADRWPAMMAIAPILVFGIIAVVLLDRLPT